MTELLTRPERSLASLNPAPSAPATGSPPTRPPSTVDAIDRDVPIPYYYQLERLIRAQLGQGRWHPDEQVPSEKQLCEAYAVSRTTVRQAIGHLVADGLLYHIKGKGTFVRRRG